MIYVHFEIFWKQVYYEHVSAISAKSVCRISIFLKSNERAIKEPSNQIDGIFQTWRKGRQQNELVMEVL